MNLELENIGLKKQILQMQAQMIQAEWNKLDEIEKGLLDKQLATPVEEEKEVSEK